MEELGLSEIQEAEKFLELEYAEGCPIAQGTFGTARKIRFGSG